MTPEQAKALNEKIKWLKQKYSPEIMRWAAVQFKALYENRLGTKWTPLQPGPAEMWEFQSDKTLPEFRKRNVRTLVENFKNLRSDLGMTCWEAIHVYGDALDYLASRRFHELEAEKYKELLTKPLYMYTRTKSYCRTYQNENAERVHQHTKSAEYYQRRLSDLRFGGFEIEEKLAAAIKVWQDALYILEDARKQITVKAEKEANKKQRIKKTVQTTPILIKEYQVDGEVLQVLSDYLWQNVKKIEAPWIGFLGFYLPTAPFKDWLRLVDKYATTNVGKRSKKDRTRLDMRLVFNSSNSTVAGGLRVSTTVADNKIPVTATFKVMKERPETGVQEIFLS